LTAQLQVLSAVPTPASTSQACALYCKPMNTETFSVRLDRSAKTRLQNLAKSTGRSRALLAAEAIHEYLDVNEWQAAGIERAIASLDRGRGIVHTRVSKWLASWETRKERSSPNRV
jgi:RHH-type rel operon transcriptional repressor/antitoxin RelB